jgi:hypothetical protein
MEFIFLVFAMSCAIQIDDRYAHSIGEDTRMGAQCCPLHTSLLRVAGMHSMA